MVLGNSKVKHGKFLIIRIIIFTCGPILVNSVCWLAAIAAIAAAAAAISRASAAANCLCLLSFASASAANCICICLLAACASAYCLSFSAIRIERRGPLATRRPREAVATPFGSIHRCLFSGDCPLPLLQLHLQDEQKFLAPAPAPWELIPWVLPPGHPHWSHLPPPPSPPPAPAPAPLPPASIPPLCKHPT